MTSTKRDFFVGELQYCITASCFFRGGCRSPLIERRYKWYPASFHRGYLSSGLFPEANACICRHCVTLIMSYSLNHFFALNTSRPTNRVCITDPDRYRRIKQYCKKHQTIFQLVSLTPPPCQVMTKSLNIEASMKINSIEFWANRLLWLLCIFWVSFHIVLLYRFCDFCTFCLVSYKGGHGFLQFRIDIHKFYAGVHA